MTSDRDQLLFVEDDAGLRRQLRWSFSDHDVVTASDRASALSCLESKQPQVVVLDLGLPPDPEGATEGLATLEAIRAGWPRIKVIIMTGTRIGPALRAVASGRTTTAKAVDVEILKIIIGRAGICSDSRKNSGT